jgi:hypothetical protein
MFARSSTSLKMNRLVCAFLFIVCAVSIATAQPGVGADFFDIVSNRTAAADKKAASQDRLEKVCPIDKSPVAKRVLTEYGAMFVASETVVPPPTCRFKDDAEVAAFQSKLATSFAIVGGTQLTFQKAAADALNAAITDAAAQGIRMRPLDGAIAGGRSYADTVRLWNSRFEPALRFWTGRKRISMEDAAAIAQMPLEQQIEKVIEWETEGMYFGTGRLGSIFSSTAPPGTSQHLSFIAIDIAPPLTPAVIALLNSHGWFQTVKGDKPHFTYLGLTEKELPGRGLKALLYNGTRYWIPNVSADVPANP